MRRLSRRLLLATATLLAACGPQEKAPARPGLAVLAQQAEGFEQARPGTTLSFPRDHGSHAGFRIEWWYLTANLKDAAGHPYGAQWTLFRFAARPRGGLPRTSAWQDGQVYMAHMALTTAEGHVAFQRYARGGDHQGLAQAGVISRPFQAWLDNWRLESIGAANSEAWLPLKVHASQAGYALDLRLESDRPPVLQGDSGFSRKHPEGGGSYYYSQPFLEARGELTIDGKSIPVHGQAWLDHEWSSQFLRPDQAGWDWFALHLESGEKLMLFRMRPVGSGPGFVHAALIAPTGEKTELDAARILLEVDRTDQVAGRTLPTGWRIELPSEGRILQVDALHPRQWMDVDFPYWEGAVTVSGDGPGNRGAGYMELTGY